MDELKKVDDKLSMDRTDELFDSAIKRSGANNRNSDYTEDDIKKQRLVIGFGNLHINTARAKLSIVRMRGYQSANRGLKQSVDRRLRNAKKYPKSNT